MIDKMSGKVTYAVISFGGFLGMGEDYYPMPWTSLKYDGTLGVIGWPSPKINSKALLDTIEIPNGIGQTEIETKLFTSIIEPPFGMLDGNNKGLCGSFTDFT
jgi:hypothetical protein